MVSFILGFIVGILATIFVLIILSMMEIVKDEQRWLIGHDDLMKGKKRKYGKK